MTQQSNNHIITCRHVPLIHTTAPLSGLTKGGMANTSVSDAPSIKAIDKISIHRISSGQVIVDLQTAVKELVENSLDAGATSIEVRFKHYGLTSVEVIDNGCGIAEKDWEGVGLKHYTSKLSTFDDLSIIRTFGFRGEAISSLCALCDNVVVTTATEGPMGIQLDLEQSGKVGKKTKIARQHGTTVMFTRLFGSLPVRRKELQRNIKREFGKALSLLNAYALGPCAGMDGSSGGVRLSVINHTENGQKVPQIKTEGVASFKASATALWGSKAMDNTTTLDLDFRVEREKSVARRINDKYSQDSQSKSEDDAVAVQVKGLISKFAVGCGRTGTDRQFFYVNGRPCNLTKVQKAFNEVYRSFNTNQSPFILADFIIPTEFCDINVSPDKRTIFMQSEQNLVDALKNALETAFSSHSSTFEVNATQSNQSARSKIAFNSPFSKRLSIRSTKSGSSSSHSRLDTPKEAVHPSIDGDPERSKILQPEASTPQAPPADGPEDTARPVTKRIDQLLKATVTSRSKTRSADETSRTTEPDPIQESLPTSKQVQQDKRIHADVEPMDVDQPPEGEKETVVMDTTKAVWNKSIPTDSASMSERRRDQSPECVDEMEGPVAKKRRVGEEDNQVVQTIVDQSVTKASVAKSGNLTSVDNLRHQLARYASGGSQATGAKGGVSTLAENGMEDEDGEECIDETKKHKAEMKGDEDGDVLIEDMEPSTSSTIGVSENQTLEVINLLTEEDGLTTPGHDQRPEIIRQSGSAMADATVQFDLERVKDYWINWKKLLPAITDNGTPTKISADASLANTEDNESAMRALERVIDKSDFANMDILGQFNLGFIIVRRRKDVCREEGKEGGIMDDLFIVDQHAADEKYNFETLQQTTKIQSQKLFKPCPVELTAADELVAMENIDVLVNNGFELDVNETAVAGARLQVTAFPVSKSTEFGMKDLEELIDLMRDQPPGRMVRCSKTRAMFAMRACRKSVMIGMPLNQSQMTSVVQHMGTIDQPWNCPHGRPTMRHLIDLYQTSLRSEARTINWSALNETT